MLRKGTAGSIYFKDFVGGNEAVICLYHPFVKMVNIFKRSLKNLSGRQSFDYLYEFKQLSKQLELNDISYLDEVPRSYTHKTFAMIIFE
ncbi:hypothetical protein SRRS_44100 [Sporomusa rhizae]